MDPTKLHDLIALLVQIPTVKENKNESLKQLEKNVEKVTELLKFSEALTPLVNDHNKVTLRFVVIGLNILKLLSQFSKDDSPLNLMSIQQQQKIKMLLQMIFSIGLTPALLQGVNTALKNKTYQLHLSNLENLSLLESYLVMTEIIKSLIEILSAPNLRSLILTHLGDLMSGLLQVIHAGRLKMPVKGVPKEKSNMNQSEEFVMTEEWYKQLVEDRNQFKIIYKELIDNIYKPLVIKELLILLAPTKNIVSGEIIPPPSWLRRAISSQLTEYLISPGGVSLIMRAMCESCSDSVDWKKAEVISKLISTVHGNLSDDEFYAKISPQVISLLNTTGPYCIPVAKNCIRNIYYHNVEICNKYIFDKLFEPFIICSKSVNKNFDGTLVSEDSLSRCIDHLTKCFATGSETSFVPVSVLLKIIKIVFQLYMKVAQSSYQHKTAIQNLLIEFLYSEKDKKNLTQIYNCLIFKEQHSDILEMNEDLEFQFGPSGGIQVSKSHKQSSPLFPEFELEYEIAGDQILELLSQRQDYSKKLVSDLFVILLSSLSDFHDQKIEMSNNNVDLLSGEDLIFFVIKVSQKRIITIKLLAVLAENVYVMETVQEKPEIVFKFVENLLDSKAKDFIRDKETESSKENDEESQEDEFKEDSNKYDTEDLLVALAVVDLITVNVKLNSDRWDTCKSLLLSLEIIKDNCEDNYIKYFSDVLHKRILSRGAVLGSKKPRTGSLNTQMMFNKNSKNNEAREGKIEQKKEAELKSQKSKKNKKLIVEVNENGDEKSEIDIALEEVCSEDVPTRGHAIIQLGKLIRKKNNDALLKKEYIFSVLKCNLKHDDSYIYLSAINALEALGGTGNSDQILELLCNEYTDNKKDSSEIQMKIGEVLMRITRGLGEVVPKYKALLINTLLFGTKSSDELLRVSSLSNLGELLKILGYGIGSILQEVFICVGAIALTDKSDMARRAAVMVAQFLLKGISENSFSILQPIIRDLYRTLLHIYKTDKDDVTRLHAELALVEINRLVKSSFNKELKLEKHIGILGLPK